MYGNSLIKNTNLNILIKTEDNNINITSEENNIYIPLLSCDIPQNAMCFDLWYKVLYIGEEYNKIFKWDLISNKPIYMFEY